MNELATYGYLLVSGLYLLLTVLLLIAWRGQRVSMYLIVACAVSVIWGASLAAQSFGEPVSPLALFCIEMIRVGTWIAFLSRLLLEVGGSRTVRYVAQLVWLGVLCAGVVQWFNLDIFGNNGALGVVLFPGGLATALIGLVLIEQLYRNSPIESRWSLKLLVLSLGGIFAFDLFFYSQAVLFKGIDSATWAARGPVNLFFVPLLAVAARRNPNWELRIFVSRHVVFYSTTLTAVGAYLLLMSAGGYLIVRYGGTWGGAARVVFFVGAIVVLLALLFSSSARAKTKVFLSKHFFQNKYDYREEWLRLIATMSKFEDSSTREVVVEAMANIVASPTGFLWMLDEQGKSYCPAATFNAEERVPDILVSDPVVKFVEKDGWLIDLNEYAREPDRYDNMEIPEWLESLSLAWLIVPLKYEQKLFGLVLLYKAPGAIRLNYEDRDLLKTVGNHIAVHLAQEKSDRLLTEAKQFETYNRLTAFLMHDLNNLIAQQSLIVDNAGKHKRNPDFVDDAIDTIASSVQRMKKVMEQLKRGDSNRLRKEVAVKFIASSAVDRCAGKRPVPTLTANSDIGISVNAEEFIMVLSHLIGNAQDATPEDGEVSVEIIRQNGDVVIHVIDTGGGMTPEFVSDRLFRPFDSTKGVEGMGIGAYQAREFARKLGGDLKAKSDPDFGTTLTMILPIR